MRLCLDPAPTLGGPTGGGDASNYVEHVDLLSLAPGHTSWPDLHWATVREVMVLKRERAAAEALVSLPASLAEATGEGAAGLGTAAASRGRPRDGFEAMVRAQFARAAEGAAPPRRAKSPPLGHY